MYFLQYLFIQHKSSMIFKLSQDLFTEVLIDLLGPVEITNLDSAACNTELRVLLLDTFSSRAFVHKGCDFETRNFNRWIILREIKIKSLKLLTDDIRSGEFDVLLTDKKLRSLLLSFQYKKKSSSVLFNTDPKSRTLESISTICSGLRELSFSFSFLDKLNEKCEEQIIKFIRSNNHLQILKSSYDNCLGKMCLQAISESCKEIQEICFHDMGPGVELIHIIQLIKKCTSLKHVILSSIIVDNQQYFQMRTYVEDDQRDCYINLTGFDDASELDKQALMSSLSDVSVLCLDDFLVTDSFIMSAIHSLSRLQVIKLESCGCLFSSFALNQLISNCDEGLLFKILLGHCSHISNIELISILTLKESGLEYIGINCHDYLDYTTLSAICSANKCLSHIYLCECPGLDDSEEVFKLVNTYFPCDEVDFDEI